MGLALRWPWKTADPYWDDFINRPPADANNLVPPAIAATTEGQVFPVKTEIHAPGIMSDQMKDLGRFFGADDVGVAELGPGGDTEYPFAIVCIVASEYNTRAVEGIGGQAAALTGGYVSFNIAGAIREYGFRATRSHEADADLLAACAGLGKLDNEGRLVTPKFGRKVHIADVIRTDLPLSPGSTERYEWAKPTS